MFFMAISVEKHENKSLISEPSDVLDYVGIDLNVLQST